MFVVTAAKMIFAAHGGVAALQRCTPAGPVLNQRYRIAESVERMQQFELVRER